CASCFARAVSSERARSSIKGATRITANKARRARIPSSLLSLTLLRLKRMLGIFVPLPQFVRVRGRVQKPFLEFGKNADKPLKARWLEPMAPDEPANLTSSSPSAFAGVEQEIARACAEARRERASVQLIAVSKTFGADAIAPVIAAGQRAFGENRVQEAKAKWPELV